MHYIIKKILSRTRRHTSIIYEKEVINNRRLKKELKAKNDLKIKLHHPTLS